MGVNVETSATFALPLRKVQLVKNLFAEFGNGMGAIIIYHYICAL